MKIEKAKLEKLVTLVNGKISIEMANFLFWHPNEIKNHNKLTPIEMANLAKAIIKYSTQM